MEIKKGVKILILSTVLLFLSGFSSGCNPIKNSYEKSVADVTPPESNILKIYRHGDEYEGAIKDCVGQSIVFQECSLSKLPLLKMVHPEPTKEDILRRVVVSDVWMGDNFAQMLDILPSDIKKLLGAVTAIVISKDIIPSYYDSSTGAIYLDPRYLWLNEAQAKTILQKSDFRDGYGETLQFLEAWRYVKDDRPAIKFYSIEAPQTRTLEDLKFALARLLYHELAHANDFTAGSENLNREKPIGEVLDANRDNYLSNPLNDKYKLNDTVLFDLAKVLYQGERPTSKLETLSASDVGEKFETQGANDLYGFNNQYEDFAMLFEESMMAYHYQIERDVAFVNKDRDYTVGWGVRKKIATPEVKERAKYVTTALLPKETDWSEFFQSELGDSTELKRVGWFESINSSDIPRRFKSFNSSSELFMDFRSPEY